MYRLTNNINGTDDTGLTIIIAALVLFFAVFIIIRLALTINDFQTELKYINGEIRRTSGKEREHWKKKKRRLWLSLLPFVRY